MTEISERKRSHLSLCATEDVEHHGATLLDEVRLLHEALPDLALDDVSLETELLGRRLRAPIVISGMTGGTDEAGRLNRALAAAAQKLGLAMGVGSQRAMLVHPDQAASYRVRDVAPEIALFANLGAVQARDSGPEAVAELVRAIGADALCVHLNTAQELVQDEGDRDFRGCLAAIAELVEQLPVPVIAKETGCGFAPGTLARLRDAGVEWVDVAGAGGTSWTAVESLRGSARQQALGQELREWGIPTAAAVVYAARAGLRVIASGGIRGAVDAAAALALGADAVSLALPFFRAFTEGAEAGVLTMGERLIEGLRVAALLTGARDPRALRRVPRVLGPNLLRWVESAK
ncbi:MAG TPA: type 2 isopentenyl-diphosphate Delta-isomerase [Myxococcota bacterium]|nr:type 2 isopentenyl-diphosphate Delta-isomerase [Myxococcota bacterium]